MKTKSTKCYLIGCLAVLLTLVTACSENNPLNPVGNCSNGTWAEEVQAEATALSNATTTYSDDPSPANCERYKTALADYFDALEGIRSCVLGVSQKAFNEAIDKAKKDLDETDCSGS